MKPLTILILFLTLLRCAFAQPTFDKPLTQLPAKNVYFISGLGADKRAFDKLRLDPSISVKHIKWITPLKKESITDYTSRLVAQIDTTQPFQLVGLSFGGIIASELSDIIHPEKVIIISSTSTGVPISSFNQKLLRFLLASPLALPILKHPGSVAYRYFGAETPEVKALLKSILKDTNGKFLKWALVAMSHWSRTDKANNLYHIHGTADKLIPVRLVSPDVVIENGGHLMVYANADQISTLLNEQILK
jgi:pimeloyl-ACP methyl ester carboxylesterase